jgi:hypothetical protein
MLSARGAISFDAFIGLSVDSPKAALTTIAALSLFDNATRREFTDDGQLVTAIGVSLSHHHIGVRYAACQCVRALSRAVAVIRTNLVDSGIGITVFNIFKKPGEDRRVTYAALSAVCNLVNEFSPLRPVSRHRHPSNIHSYSPVTFRYTSNKESYFVSLNFSTLAIPLSG